MRGPSQGQEGACRLRPGETGRAVQSPFRVGTLWVLTGHRSRAARGSVRDGGLLFRRRPTGGRTGLPGSDGGLSTVTCPARPPRPAHLHPPQRRAPAVALRSRPPRHQVHLLLPRRCPQRPGPDCSPGPHDHPAAQAGTRRERGTPAEVGHGLPRLQRQHLRPGQTLPAAPHRLPGHPPARGRPSQPVGRSSPRPDPTHLSSIPGHRRALPRCGRM